MGIQSLLNEPNLDSPAQVRIIFFLKNNSIYFYINYCYKFTNNI